MDELRVGVIGMRRGASLVDAFRHIAGARVTMLHDVDTQRLAGVAGTLGVHAEPDWDRFLAADLDAIVVASPMPFHARQAIAALDAGKAVLAEVMPCRTMPEAHDLAAAARRHPDRYMLAENAVFLDTVEAMRRLVASGVFGRILSAEGDYVHDCAGLFFTEDGDLTWRGRGDLGIYGTHALGPLLHITGDRVARVRASALPGCLIDPALPIAAMHLLEMQTVGGITIRTRVDVSSPRPHPSTTYYGLQGTAGAWESARFAGDTDRVWLRDRHEPSRFDVSPPWHPLQALFPEVIPDRGAAPTSAGGHGTTEFWMLSAFVEAVRAGAPMPVGIHAALDMTLPCILGLDSAANDGAWIPVPDSRTWGEASAGGGDRLLPG
ncbi:MAG: Gfo/Idh/MocA family oxidoreductase [Thermomicrobiales bacterium]